MARSRFPILIYFIVLTSMGLTSEIPSIKLSSGHDMPIIGLGTWLTDSDDVDRAVTTALEIGYRHIDTAFLYENEVAIGKSLKKYFDNGGKREDLFITTKLPMIGMSGPGVEKFLKLSLEYMDLEYVDMYLVHHAMGMLSPAEEEYTLAWNEDGTIKLDMSTDHVSIWKAMEAQVKAGRTKSIGVSNFNISQIQRIIDHAEIKPSNLQIELHGYLQQNDLVKFCIDNNISITSYGTLGSRGSKEVFQNLRDEMKSKPTLMENPVVVKISQSHSKTPAQVLLRHFVQKNIIVIPKSVKPERIKENFDIFDFELTEEEVKEMDGLDIGEAGRLFDVLDLFKGVENHPEYPYLIYGH